MRSASRFCRSTSKAVLTSDRLSVLSFSSFSLALSAAVASISVVMSRMIPLKNKLLSVSSGTATEMMCSHRHPLPSGRESEPFHPACGVEHLQSGGQQAFPVVRAEHLEPGFEIGDLAQVDDFRNGRADKNTPGLVWAFGRWRRRNRTKLEALSMKERRWRSLSEAPLPLSPVRRYPAAPSPKLASADLDHLPLDHQHETGCRPFLRPRHGWLIVTGRACFP